MRSVEGIRMQAYIKYTFKYVHDEQNINRIAFENLI